MCVCLSVYFFCLFLLLVLLCVYPLNRWEKGTSGNIASHSIKLITFAGGFIRKVSKKKEEFHFLFLSPTIKTHWWYYYYYLPLPDIALPASQLVNRRERKSTCVLVKKTAVDRNNSNEISGNFFLAKVGKQTQPWLLISGKHCCFCLLSVSSPRTGALTKKMTYFVVARKPFLYFSFVNLSNLYC